MTLTRTERPAAGPALERLESLCDAGSLELIRTGVLSDGIGDRDDAEGAAVGADEDGGLPLFRERRGGVLESRSVDASFGEQPWTADEHVTARETGLDPPSGQRRERFNGL